jgi:sulfatase modifying factor 1
MALGLADRRLVYGAVLTALAFSAFQRKAASAPENPSSPSCPPEMALVGVRFCIDRYEGTTLEIEVDGRATPHSPYLPVTGLRVRAVSQKQVIPQAYISRDEAGRACQEAGKRLCTSDEWLSACRGSRGYVYPYGNQRHESYCVDSGRVAPLPRLFGGSGIDFYRYGPMNDPRLNQIEGTVAPTASFPRCTNELHVYDMVGNLHEWTADAAGTFRGGYYLDTKINGEGCTYRTVAHPGSYHDYSTGFRCCADL